MKDYYKILQVSRDAPIAEIKKSYKRLAMIYHPDRNKDEQASNHFILITEAYEILSDEDKRLTYDNLYFAKSDVQISQQFYNWQESARQKGAKYSKMDFEYFSKTISKEVEILLDHAPNFGCLLGIFIGVITGIWLIFQASQKGDSDMVGAGFLCLIVYGAFAFWLYPKFTKSYKEDRNDKLKK